jgi:predicted ATPase
LGENGVGKSTILQALGLLLAGPDGANQLLTKPLGWLRDEKNQGKISARIHKEENDPGVYGDKNLFQRGILRVCSGT